MTHEAESLHVCLARYTACDPTSSYEGRGADAYRLADAYCAMTSQSLLLEIDPVVPSLISVGVNDWQHMHTLKQEVNEHGWDGAMLSPEVRRLVKNARAALQAQP